MANVNVVYTRNETAQGLRQLVPNGFLVNDKDGTALVPSDLNRVEFTKYLGQIFQRGPKPGDAAWATNEKFVGYCIQQIFATTSNTTVSLGLDDIITYLGTAANVPIGVGAGVENPTDNLSRIIWSVLNAIKHARGLKIPEESPNFS